ncbi:MAG: cob(I)yrinic acid a,c-diamide adenosyltransferase [Phocaeicola sp.]
MAKVYTKTGDKGTTSLVGGTRVAKTHVRLDAYGTIDELSSNLGLLYTYLTDEDDKKILLHIQHKLFTLGAYLATDTEQTTLRIEAQIREEDIDKMEQHIDAITALLPELRAFILPGGSRDSAICHVCRTVCRRAERAILEIQKEHEVDGLVIAYVNRLSDYLFVLARKLNLLAGTPEICWDKTCK